MRAMDETNPFSRIYCTAVETVNTAYAGRQVPNADIKTGRTFPLVGGSSSRQR